jgi:hypothetical protein
MKHAWSLAVILSLLLGMVIVPPAMAATTFTVNSFGDRSDADLSDNVCDFSLNSAGEECNRGN